MRRDFLSLTAGAICAVLAGCGAQGEAYQPRPVPVSKSVIYLYRPYNFYAAAIAPMITCGQESIEMEAGGYYSFVNDSGSVTCAATTEASTQLKFDAHPGQEYYVREEVSPGNLAGRTQFTLMNTENGRTEIASCRKQGLPDTGSHH